MLAVIYLVFNEGYAATRARAGARATVRAKQSGSARLLVELLPRRAEAAGLLALMLLHDARRPRGSTPTARSCCSKSRTDALGPRADRRRARARRARAARAGRPGAYAMQAAIAGVHARAARAEETDWPQIAGLYRVLLAAQPSPVVALNHAVAVAMAEGPAAGCG